VRSNEFFVFSREGGEFFYLGSEVGLQRLVLIAKFFVVVGESLKLGESIGERVDFRFLLEDFGFENSDCRFQRLRARRGKCAVRRGSTVSANSTVMLTYPYTYDFCSS
jgi:hypothetical protein